MAQPNVEEAATSPKSTTVDGVTVVNRDLKEVREAEQHVARNAAKANTFFGIGLRRVNPGSAVRE